MDHNSKSDESSQKNMEYHSELGSELEEGSTASLEDKFLSIWYPSPPYFPKPYLQKWDFKNAEQALKYIMKCFSFKLIHTSLQSFPGLSNDFIHCNTFVNTVAFPLIHTILS